jgi:P27 family predicted phage terminase small subunit
MPGVKGQRSGGHNKKSAQTHVVQGTFRGDRHADAVASEPPKGRPSPPKPLEGDALDEWDRMVGRLEQSGTLSVVDDAALYQYARLFAETEAAAVSQLETNGSVQILEENVGDLKGPELVAAFQEISKMRRLEASYATQIRQGRMAIRQYLVEFGQTPAARQRVKVPPTKEPSKAEKFRMKKGA